MVTAESARPVAVGATFGAVDSDELGSAGLVDAYNTGAAEQAEKNTVNTPRNRRVFSSIYSPPLLPER
jgi:hypothetical protein